MPKRRNIKRRDFWVGQPRIAESALSVRLVLEGYNSQFYFEWPSMAGLGGPSGVSAEDAARIAMNVLLYSLQQ